MQILLTNTASSQLSVDIPLKSGKAIRGTLLPGASMDVSQYADLGSLQNNAVLRAMRDNGQVSLTTTTDSTDVNLQFDDQLISGVQQTAANLAETFLATAEMDGFLVAEAQVGAIPASGESMAVTLKKNGSTVGSALTINATNSPAARTVLAMSLGGATVRKGDELSWSLAYTAGGGPTPIVRTALRVKVLKPR